MLIKTLKIQIKGAGPDDGMDEGQFTGYASVFGNIDLYGDKVVKGAFTRTLAEWDKKDAVIPLLYGHDTVDPNNNIGWLLNAAEDDHGLLVKGQIDLDGGNGPQVYRLIKGRRLGEMSFAYDVKEAAWVVDKEAGEEFYELRDLDLFEVSLVPIGANRETELLEVKNLAQKAERFAREVKAGRVISAKNEDVLKTAQSLIADASEKLAEVLSAVAATEDSEEEKARAEGPAKSDEEPRGAKSDEEPNLRSSVDAYLAVIESELTTV